MNKIWNPLGLSILETANTGLLAKNLHDEINLKYADWASRREIVDLIPVGRPIGYILIKIESMLETPSCLASDWPRTALAVKHTDYVFKGTTLPLFLIYDALTQMRLMCKIVGNVGSGATGAMVAATYSWSKGEDGFRAAIDGFRNGSRVNDAMLTSLAVVEAPFFAVCGPLVVASACLASCVVGTATSSVAFAFGSRPTSHAPVRA